MPDKKKRSTALIISMLTCCGIGFLLTNSAVADIGEGISTQISKFHRVIQLAQMYYVEDIEWNDAMEGAISGMLEKMDPHSVYIPPKKVQENDENFSGKYEGIGVQYDIIDRYLTVISPFAGSPADVMGVVAGDRIIEINGKSIVGIARDDVSAKLKGPKGSTVRITIERDGVAEPFELLIERDVIPISTIGASFVIDDTTGYIWVTRFASPTAREVEEELEKLEQQKIQRLILDLRGNSGGYLHEAVKIAAKFIPGHKMVVFTKGRSDEVEEQFFADQFGRRVVRNYPLIVLLDKGSASASEIVAGALQDYDRAILVGENSFGKGLVQKQFALQDGSAVRVTTAKYYTPSGRCIQRAYKGKDIEEYYEEISDSSWNAENNADGRPLFYTEKGRHVYGGGGIQPDFTVERQNFVSPELLNQILQHRLFFKFATDYAHRHQNLKTDFESFARRFSINDALFEAFRRFCRGAELKFEDAEFDRDRQYVKLRIKAEIARNFWDADGYHYVMLQEDEQFMKALDLFPEARRLFSMK